MMMLSCRAPRASLLRCDLKFFSADHQRRLSSSTPPSGEQNAPKPKRRGMPDGLRKWYLENPGAAGESPRKWRLENPGMAVERMRKWHLQNPDGSAARSRKYLDETPKMLDKLRSRCRTMNERRHLVLREKLNGGVFRINRCLDEKRIRNLYSFVMGCIHLPIPKVATTLWDLDSAFPKDLTIHVRVDVTRGPHEHAWAKKAIPSDDASRVGIEVRFKDFEPVWLHTKSVAGVPSANSLADWVDGKIEDLQNHNWGRDRLPIIGTMSQLVSKSSWNSTLYEDPSKRRTTDSEIVRNNAKWILTSRAKKGFDALREKIDNEDDMAVFDYAFDFLDEFGYLPGGLFARQDHGGLRITIRPEALARLKAGTQARP